METINMSRLYLDFDGVINVFRERKSPPWKMSTGWDTHRIYRFIVEHEAYRIHYSPEVVSFLNNLATSGVDIIWCTTWQQHTRMFHQIDFDSYRWLDISSPVDDTSFAGTKERAVREHLAYDPVECAVWCDDDLPSSGVDGSLHMLKIDPYTGLTPAICEKLTKLLIPEL